MLFSRHSGRSLQRTLSAGLWLPVKGPEPVSYSVSKQLLLTAQHDGGATCVDATSLLGFSHPAGAEGFAASGWLRRCSQAASESSGISRCTNVEVESEPGNTPATPAHAAVVGQHLQSDAGCEAREVFVDSEAALRQHHVRFVDRLRVDAAAGHGGRGCVSFVRSATRGAHEQHAQ